MKFLPQADRILVRVDKREERTPGGIIIPETADEKRSALPGRVVAVGPGRMLDSGRRCEPGVQAEDRVLFSKYAGTEIIFEGDKLLVLREDDILCVVEENKD